jgi:hypothetical protein
MNSKFPASLYVGLHKAEKYTILFKLVIKIHSLLKMPTVFLLDAAMRRIFSLLI